MACHKSKRISFHFLFFSLFFSCFYRSKALLRKHERALSLVFQRFHPDSKICDSYWKKQNNGLSKTQHDCKRQEDAGGDRGSAEILKEGEVDAKKAKCLHDYDVYTANQVCHTKEYVESEWRR